MKKDLSVSPALAGESAAVARLMLKLWPEHELRELMEEAEALAASEGDAAFLLRDGEGAELGFAHCSLRHDYVEGTETSPVGYLEGIYIDEAARGRGGASMLLKACECWARGKGCLEFASDCELDNSASLAFHLALGFEEANRVICFKKRL